MQSPIPEFMVSDVQATIKFYEEALGFEIAFTLPDGDGNLVHASVRNGDAMIMFAPLTAELKSGPDALGKGAALYLMLDETDDIDGLFTRAEAAGANVIHPPKDEFWGDRVFGVADPDGYQIFVGKHVREVSMEEMTAAIDAMAAPV
jgi:PhnB protein